MIIAALCSGCGSSSADTAIEAGMTDIEDHNYTEAIDTFTKAINNGASARKCWRGIGISYLDQSQYDPAIEAFKKSLASSCGIVDSMDFDTNFYLAQCYYQKGDYTSAINGYNAILSLRSTDAEALYLRGICYLAQNDHDKALADFKQTVKLDGEDYDRIIKIYQYLSQYGYEDEGKAILEGVVDKEKMTNYELGQVSFYLGNNADAQNYLELAKSEKNDEDKTPIILLLGQTGEKQGDYNYAISVYRSYLEESPEHADVYNRLGICEMEMAKAQNDSSYYQAAVTDFEAGIALKDETETQSLMRNEITAYEYAGDFATAKTLMDTYLQSYPDDADAQREAIFLSTRAQ